MWLYITSYRKKFSTPLEARLVKNKTLVDFVSSWSLVSWIRYYSVLDFCYCNKMLVKDFEKSFLRKKIALFYLHVDVLHLIYVLLFSLSQGNISQLETGSSPHVYERCEKNVSPMGCTLSFIFEYAYNDLWQSSRICPINSFMPREFKPSAHSGREI